MLKRLLSVFLLFIFAFALAGCSQRISAGESEKDVNKKTQVTNINSQKTNSYSMSSAETIADKLEVYYFYRTARCYSCKTISQYVKETIEDKYSKQTSNGIIDFREINIDLAENKEIARKFQASG